MSAMVYISPPRRKERKDEKFFVFR